MGRKLLAVALAVGLMLSVTACGAVGAVLDKTQSENPGEVVTAVEGHAEGRIGDVMRSEFFEYTVLSAKYVEEYAGYKPASGNKLVDTVVRIKNIFGEELNMYYDDLQIQWGDGDNDYGYGIDALDDTMIPAEFIMAKGKTLEYHIVYEVPENDGKYSISYQEYFEDDSEGDVFFVYFELETVARV